MNTQLIMKASALVLGIIGLILNFAPIEAASYLNISAAPILLQLLGAAYFGFAILNWMAKANIIDGIYSRPVAFGNFSHFLVAGFSLLKMGALQTDLIVLAAIFLGFAALFGYILFFHPGIKS